jgi:hypothetical protein
VGELFYVLIRGRVEVSVDGVVKAELRGCADRCEVPAFGGESLTGLTQVSRNGQLLSRRGRSLPANASGFDTHRDSSKQVSWTIV